MKNEEWVSSTNSRFVILSDSEGSPAQIPRVPTMEANLGTRGSWRPVMDELVPDGAGIGDVSETRRRRHSGTTLRRCNEAHGVETKPGGTDSSITGH